MLEFCEECREIVEYHIKKEKMTKKIKGTEIEYTGKISFCNECKTEIFIAEIRDYNLMMLDESFRKKEGLIKVSEIEIILERYDIGKRPLSLLLGWGELTLTRYLDGGIPTKQYSDILRKVFDDQSYMMELLEKNKDKIKEVAYRRCSDILSKLEIDKIDNISSEDKIDNISSKDKIDNISSKDKIDNIGSKDKIDYVIKYLLVTCLDITPLALQKLLYYTQAFFKVFTGTDIFNNDCEAWVHGPVYRSVYNKYKDYGCVPIETDNNEWLDMELNIVEKEVLDNIVRNFGCYSGKVLEKMTHAEMPWIHTRMSLGDKEDLNPIIEKELIAKYFNDIKLKYNMLNISDIVDYSTDLFNKIV